MTQPEALRLADLLEEAPAYTLEDGTITLYLGGTVVADKAAAELRRLHAKCEALTEDTTEEMRRITELYRVTAQRDALLEALKEIQDWTARATARAAIAKVEENKYE